MLIRSTMQATMLLSRLHSLNALLIGLVHRPCSIVQSYYYCETASISRILASKMRPLSPPMPFFFFFFNQFVIIIIVYLDSQIDLTHRPTVSQSVGAILAIASPSDRQTDRQKERERERRVYIRADRQTDRHPDGEKKTSRKQQINRLIAIASQLAVPLLILAGAHAASS